MDKTHSVRIIRITEWLPPDDFTWLCGVRDHIKESGRSSYIKSRGGKIICRDEEIASTPANMRQKFAVFADEPDNLEKG